jgi:hypothetical protein
MNKLLLFVCVALTSCGGSQHTIPNDELPDSKLDFKGGVKGIQCRHLADRYIDSISSYQVQALLINSGKKRIKYLQLNASYLNDAGKEIATALGGPESEIMPGDSGLVVVSWSFQKDNLPNKVVLTVSN